MTNARYSPFIFSVPCLSSVSAWELMRSFLMIVILAGCDQGLLSVQPRNVWMTTRDGPIPTGENSYLNYWCNNLDFKNGEINEFQRLQDYVFVEITGKQFSLDENNARKLLKQSIDQCRSAFCDAYSANTLRYWPETGRKNIDGIRISSAFKSKYIVFLLYRTPKANENELNVAADYGTILSVGEVLCRDSDPMALVINAKLIAKPFHYRETNRTLWDDKPVLDLEYDIITEFERKQQVTEDEASVRSEEKKAGVP